MDLTSSGVETPGPSQTTFIERTDMDVAHYIDIDNFRYQLDQGLITDFTPYLKRNVKSHVRCELAKRGLCIEELAKMEEVPVVCSLITYGYATEYYERWSKHTSPDIRLALSENGYFPEKFLRDRDRLVRAAVLEKHPEYAFHLLSGTNYERDKAEGIIHNMADIMLEQMETYVRKIGGLDLRGEHYRLKLESLRKVPTPMEATMTPQALHTIGNSLWARGYSLKQLEIFEAVERDLLEPNEMEALYAVWDQIAEAESLWDCKDILEPELIKVLQEQDEDLVELIYRGYTVKDVEII